MPVSLLEGIHLEVCHILYCWPHINKPLLINMGGVPGFSGESSRLELTGVDSYGSTLWRPQQRKDRAPHK